MSKILYPIFNLPNEHDEENEAVPTWIKWWMINNYKKRSWVLSEIITGNPLTLENSVETKFYLPPLPRGNSEQNGEPSPTNEVPITNVTGDVEVLVQNKNLFDYENYTYDKTIFTDYRYIEIKNLKPNTAYTIYNYESLSGSEFINVFLSSSPSYSGISFANLVGASYRTYTTNATGKVYLCTYSNSWTEELWNTFINYFKNAMFVEGTNRTAPYTQHKEQTYTFPLGTQRMYLGDYLADDGIHHVRKQRSDIEDIINGYGVNSTSNVPYVRITKDNIGMVSGTNINNTMLMTSYTEKTSSNFNVTPSGYFNTYYDRYYVYIFDDRFTSLEVAKQLLDGELIEYELATEEITPYTTEQQTAYNEIKQAISYEEQTNISGTSSELEPIFEVQYYMINESEGE